MIEAPLLRRADDRVRLTPTVRPRCRGFHGESTRIFPDELGLEYAELPRFQGSQDLVKTLAISRKLSPDIRTLSLAANDCDLRRRSNVDRCE